MDSPSNRPVVDVVLASDDLAELALLADGLLGTDRYGDGVVHPLVVTADVDIGTHLALRDPDGTHLATAVVTSLSGKAVRTGPVTVHQPPRMTGFPDMFRPSVEVRAALDATGRATVLAWQSVMPPSAAATEEVIAHCQLRDAALLFQPVVTAADDRRRAADLRAARVVRDELAVSVPVVARALPSVVRDRGYAAAVSSALGAADVLQVEAQSAEDRPARAEVLAAHTAGRPPMAGVVILLTGLSGSGKSTIALEVYGRLLEDGRRTVTLLDGDLVRRSLSSELTFSKPHRDLNVRRIGYVASEIAGHGGIAICAPIAPYDEVRQDVRRMVEAVDGRFVLVHVDTPLDVCEQRDVKGLYARARAGEIPDFTGISDPYEVPKDADLTIDTSRVSVERAANLLLDLLRREGRLP